jgi:hypothetical protein
MARHAAKAGRWATLNDQVQMEKTVKFSIYKTPTTLYTIAPSRLPTAYQAFAATAPIHKKEYLQ